MGQCFSRAWSHDRRAGLRVEMTHTSGRLGGKAPPVGRLCRCINEQSCEAPGCFSAFPSLASTLEASERTIAPCPYPVIIKKPPLSANLDVR